MHESPSAVATFVQASLPKVEPNPTAIESPHMTTWGPVIVYGAVSEAAKFATGIFEVVPPTPKVPPWMPITTSPGAGVASGSCEPGTTVCAPAAAVASAKNSMKITLRIMVASAHRR